MIGIYVGMTTDAEAAQITLSIVDFIAIDVMGVQIHSVEFVFHVQTTFLAGKILFCPICTADGLPIFRIAENIHFHLALIVLIFLIGTFQYLHEIGRCY